MTPLKLIPIGGMGDVTKNMYLYEYDSQILIVDCGIGFPSSSMLGIDVLIPDISYLKDKQSQIVGMLLTHAHDDHIAALPYILPELPNIPIYGSKLTIGFAQDRLKDFDQPADFREFPVNSPLQLGPFLIEAIKVTHSVPDSRHYAITSPQGTIYHGSDFKFDLTPIDGVVSDYQKIAKIGQQGVLCLLSDCLRSEKTTHSLSEALVSDTFEREIRGVKGKYIVTAMSSNVHRIQLAVNTAIAHKRKVAFIGRSVEQNIQTATRLGFFEIPEKAVINKKKISKLPPSEVCVIIAGSQGQPESSLSRAAIGDHRYLEINPEDKVVFSSEPIPGNEDNVYKAIDNISRIGAEVSYSDVDDNLHVSGHASAIEQQLLMELIKPKYFVPIGGTYRHMVQYRKLVGDMHYDTRNTFLLTDGQTIEFENGMARPGATIRLKHVMVDGTGVGDIGSIVLSDRAAMADSGIVVIVIPLNQETGQLTRNIEVISRGFVFMKQSGEIVDQIIEETIKVLDKYHDTAENWPEMRRYIESSVSDFIYQQVQREPLVLPVLMSV